MLLIVALIMFSMVNATQINHQERFVLLVKFVFLALNLAKIVLDLLNQNVLNAWLIVIYQELIVLKHVQVDYI